MKQVRVLLYAWDHAGLGHVNRLLAVINGIKDAYDAADFFILAEQESPLLRLAGWPFVCVPRFSQSYKGQGDDEEFPDTSEITQLKAKLAQQMVASLFTSFRPDVIIHDTVLWMPLFDAAAAHGIPQVLIIRYRKDMHEYLTRIASELQHIEAIILPHEKEEIRNNDIPPEIQFKVHFSGPVLNIRHSLLAPNTLLALRQKYNIGATIPTIVITGGGGGYTTTQLFFEYVAEALAQVITSPVLAIAVLGYFYMGTLTIPESPYVKWSIVGFDNHLPALMASADLVITQVGYNTINELRAVQTPALLIPGDRPFDDQALRAHQAAASFDNLFVVDPFTVNQVQTILKPLLPLPARREKFHPDLVNFTGHQRCAQIILNLLNSSRSS
jgi:predicted glycosyltransferase